MKFCVLVIFAAITYALPQAAVPNLPECPVLSSCTSTPLPPNTLQTVIRGPGGLICQYSSVDVCLLPIESRGVEPAVGLCYLGGKVFYTKAGTSGAQGGRNSVSIGNCLI